MCDGQQSGKMSRAEVIISGRVQGVWFRSSTVDMARSLGLKGWVRNRPDRRVEAVFEGPEHEVRQAVSWCYRGPTMARVESVDVKWKEPTGEYPEFSTGW